jgi:hypothetical protein
MTATEKADQSMNVTSQHREFRPAIHQKTLVWLLLTFFTSPSTTTIQIAIASR